MNLKSKITTKFLVNTVISTAISAVGGNAMRKVCNNYDCCDAVTNISTAAATFVTYVAAAGVINTVTGLRSDIAESAINTVTDCFSKGPFAKEETEEEEEEVKEETKEETTSSFDYSMYDEDEEVICYRNY